MKRIFIGGCPRSGTTFLAALLSRSTKFSICWHESPFLENYLKQFKSNTIYRSKELHDFLMDFERYRIWRIDPKNCSKNVFPLEFLDFASNKESKNHQIVIDHTPENIIRSGNIMNLIKQDDIHFIHLIRDGRACFSSFKNCDWGPKESKQAANFWNQNVARSSSTGECLGDKIFTIKYEDILSNSELEIKKILDWLSLKYEKSSYVYLTPSYSKKQHKKISKDPDIKNVNNWKNILKKREIVKFNYYARDQLLKYKYIDFKDSLEYLDDRKVKFRNNLFNKFRIIRRSFSNLL